MVEHARTIHNTSPIATAALGRLPSRCHDGNYDEGKKDLLTLQIKGTSPIGGIVVTTNSDGIVKGYVHHPEVMLDPSPRGKLDVGGAIGEGMLTVIKDLGLKEPYVGQTKLISGEIAEDLTYYYATSEQIPSGVALGVLMNKNNTVRRAGGFIIQLMPDAGERLSVSEENISNLDGITDLLDKDMSRR